MLIVKVVGMIVVFKLLMAFFDLVDIKLEDRKKGTRKKEGRYDTKVKRKRTRGKRKC